MYTFYIIQYNLKTNVVITVLTRKTSTLLNNPHSCSEAIIVYPPEIREKLCSELSVSSVGLEKCSPPQVESWAKVELDWGLAG